MTTLTQEHLDILWTFRTQPEHKKTQVKRFLMPEDNLDDLIFDVSAHPTSGRDGEPVFSFAEITVLQKPHGELFRECEIFVNNPTLSQFLGRLCKYARGHAKTRLSKGRLAAGICHLLPQDVRGLWDRQHGLCYYSKIPMNPRPMVDWQCSLERLDTAQGYIPSNVVLCCLEFNGGAVVIVVIVFCITGMGLLVAIVASQVRSR